jgi:hypothetical protein
MLNDFIHIRQQLQNLTISGNEIGGDFLPNPDDIEKLKRLSSANCIENFVVVDNKNKLIEHVTINDRIQVRLYPNQLGNEKYFETFEDLIKTSSQTYPKNRFFVNLLSFDSIQQIQPTQIQNYLAFTKLISFLRIISDYQKGNEIVFFQAKQLILTTDYSINDLVEIKELDSLVNHIQESADKEERRIIFTNELIASLSKILEPNNRFSFLVKNFSDLTANYHKSHSLYLEKYSYQKFKSEIDKEIIEYSKKIQAVINDAQTKLVAIPAAFLLIIGQFDLTGEKLYFNLALILSAFVFSILLEVLLRNQFSALDFVKDDIDRFKNSVDDKKIGILGDDFTNVFTKINNLHSKQKSYLNIIRFLVWLTPVFAIGLFILSLTNNTFICILRTIFSRF